MPNVYDVVIIGAGPAGSTAAYYVSLNAKLKVLIIDRHKFPRFKACGGVLNHIKELNRLMNYSNIKDKIHTYPTNAIQFYWDTQPAFYKEYNKLFCHIDRYEFDNLLLKEALKRDNVTFKRFNVQEIIEIENLIVLKDGINTIRCNFIIGADGWCSTVSNYLENNKRDNNDYGLCVEHDIACAKTSNVNHIFYFYGKEPGYAWVFPTKDGYYLGLGYVRETKRHVNEYLQQFLDHCIVNNIIPRKHVIRDTFGAPVPVTISKNYATDRILLCGDALGTVRQVTGEGIYYSMLSGKIAGNTLQKTPNNLKDKYKKAIKPLLKRVSIVKRIPNRRVIYFIFGLMFSILTASRIPARLREKLQDWFIRKFLDIRPLKR